MGEIEDLYTVKNMSLTVHGRFPPILSRFLPESTRNPQATPRDVDTRRGAPVSRKRADADKEARRHRHEARRDDAVDES
jgi:hypothetical protein